MRKMYRALACTVIGLGLLFCACSNKKGSSVKKEMRLTEDNHLRLVENVPPPKLETSQERKNLVRRLERFNIETKISYIYLFSDYGNIIYFTTVKGKVSSVNSLLTTPEQIVYRYSASAIVASPDLDGSYGSNGDAIFWFNDQDVYFEWNGKYVLLDQPLQITTKPILIEYNGTAD